MIDMIFEHQGTVEQLIGDEIVALFGLTESEPDAAAARRASPPSTWSRACRRLAARWAAAGLPTFDIGVGISSGR